MLKDNFPDLPPEVKTAIVQFESTAMSFAIRFINDEQERYRYNIEVRNMVATVLRQYKLGELSESETAQAFYNGRQVLINMQTHKASILKALQQQIPDLVDYSFKQPLPNSNSIEKISKFASTERNIIMEQVRANTSDIGLAKVKLMKEKGKTFTELQEYYAVKKYNQSFQNLNVEQRNNVWLEIIKGAARGRKEANQDVVKMGKWGRRLFWLSFICMVYEVLTSQNKPKTLLQHAGIMSAGYLGGVAAGAVSTAPAGLVCGPAAPVCVTAAAFVGGVIAAMGMEYTMHHWQVLSNYYYK